MSLSALIGNLTPIGRSLASQMSQLMHAIPEPGFERLGRDDSYYFLRRHGFQVGSLKDFRGDWWRIAKAQNDWDRMKYVGLDKRIMSGYTVTDAKLHKKFLTNVRLTVADTETGERRFIWHEISHKDEKTRRYLEDIAMNTLQEGETDVGEVIEARVTGGLVRR